MEDSVKYNHNNLSKENAFNARMFSFLLKSIINPFVRLVWIKEVSGHENLPKSGAYIIAANHQSYFDFISLVSVMPRKLTFLAAEKFYNSSFWRPIMEYTGQIKVERDAEDKSEVIEKGLVVLKQGDVLAIFPQGTRSRSGEIEKVFSGVARFALEARVPVVPVGIVGAYRVQPPQRKFPKLKKMIEVNIGVPIQFDEYYGEAKTPELYRKVTDEIMAEIARLANKEYAAK